MQDVLRKCNLLFSRAYVQQERKYLNPPPPDLRREALLGEREALLEKIAAIDDRLEEMGCVR